MNADDALYETLNPDDMVKALTVNPNKPTLTARNYLRFVDLIYWREDYYQWNGCTYQRADEDMLRSTISEYLQKCRTEPSETHPKGLPFFPMRKHIDEVLAAVKNHCVISPHRETNSAADGTIENRIVFKNGRLDLATGILHPHDPSYLVMNALSFAYEAGDGAPTRWLQFLSEVWPYEDPNAEGSAIQLLQEIMGYLFSGQTNLHKVFLMVGEGRAGKGTIVRVIQHILGSHNCCGVAFEKLSAHFGLEGAINKALITVPDMRVNHRADLMVTTERMLSISGEDWISVERKNKTDWEGRLPGRMMIISNTVPRLPDPSGVVATRLVPLHFAESFLGREDVHLMDKLLPEAATILNWSLEGLRRLNQRGAFVIPKSAHELLDDVRCGSQPELVFFDEFFFVGHDATVTKDAAYKAYDDWCASNGYKACNSAEYGKRLKQFFPKVTESRPGCGSGRRLRYWCGIGLLADQPLSQKEIDRQHCVAAYVTQIEKSGQSPG